MPCLSLKRASAEEAYFDWLSVDGFALAAGAGAAALGSRGCSNTMMQPERARQARARAASRTVFIALI